MPFCWVHIFWVGLTLSLVHFFWIGLTFSTKTHLLDRADIQLGTHSLDRADIQLGTYFLDRADIQLGTYLLGRADSSHVRQTTTRCKGCNCMLAAGPTIWGSPSGEEELPYMESHGFSVEDT